MSTTTFDLRGVGVKSVWKEWMPVILASLLLSLSGSFSFYLPSISPVPFTLQNQLIFVLPVLLGRKKAFVAIAALLCEAAIGLPVLSGASGGLHKFVGPTAGYLAFYAISPFIIAPIYEKLRSNRNSYRAFVAISIGSLLNFAMGWMWLATFLGATQAFMVGVLPYVMGDLFKTAIMSKLMVRDT